MKKTISAVLTALIFASLILFAGCSAKLDLTRYVSEYRSDIYMGTEGEYSVFASYSTREYPYTADGNVGNMTELFEVAITVPDNTKTYTLRYTVSEKEYSSELSFDSVRLVHRCSQSMPAPTEKQITFQITTDEENAETITVTASSIKTEKTLDESTLLQKIQEKESERFAAMTSGNTFAGELYVRLLYDNDRCFYYVGLIDRNGKTYSMLADAETGEIIATRQ